LYVWISLTLSWTLVAILKAQKRLGSRTAAVDKDSNTEKKTEEHAKTEGYENETLHSYYT
jgi:hypothetical protein